jgi:hypothetical protein
MGATTTTVFFVQFNAIFPDANKGDAEKGVYRPKDKTSALLTTQELVTSPLTATACEVCLAAQMFAPATPKTHAAAHVTARRPVPKKHFIALSLTDETKDRKK